MLRIPHMQKMQWDPLKDFTYIVGVSATPSASRPRRLAVQDLQRLHRAARKEPGKIDYGSTGAGSSPHLLMEELALNARCSSTTFRSKGNADLAGSCSAAT